MTEVLCIIPARGGSKGLPGKNIKPIADIPLIGHVIKCAAAIPAIARTVISTDDPEIAEVARSYGGETPFERPSELATDLTPMAGVLTHALDWMESHDGIQFDAVVLMDPTSPGRDPEAVQQAIDLLRQSPTEVDGVVSVSRPFFNPVWVGVKKNSQNELTRYFSEGLNITRRQDNEEPYYRINGSFYVWRAEFVRNMPDNWADSGNFIGFETPEIRSFAIDYLDEFKIAKTLIESGIIDLPWVGTNEDPNDKISEVEQNEH